jgi:hypothetical protein
MISRGMLSRLARFWPLLSFSMSAPLVGRRVRIEGLASKPELNGTEGLAASWDDAKGRYNVKLDAGDAFMALRPGSLVPVGRPTEDDATRGGGFGGMPGMGGMGGGAQAAMLQALIARLVASASTSLPAGLDARALGVGVVGCAFMLPRVLGIGVLQSLLLGGLGGFALIGARGGGGVRGVAANARALVSKFGGAVSRVSGRPVSDPQAGVLLVATLFLAWKYALAPAAVGADGGAAGYAGEYAAYQKGYNDGQARATYSPIKDEGGGRGRSSGAGGFGIGSLFNMALAGSMLYQWAGTPPSLENLMANARNANPMQLMMLFQILSSLFF